MLSTVFQNVQLAKLVVIVTSEPTVHYVVNQTRVIVTRYLTLPITKLNVDQYLSILLTGSITIDVHFFVYTLRGEVTMLSKTETRVKSHSYIHLSYQ